MIQDLNMRPKCEWEYKKGVICGNRITEKINEFSKRKYGKSLCWGHQKQTDFKALKVDGLVVSSFK